MPLVVGVVTDGPMLITDVDKSVGRVLFAHEFLDFVGAGLGGVGGFFFGAFNCGGCFFLGLFGCVADGFFS